MSVRVWGVGRRYKVRLNKMGIHTVYQLAVCEPAKIRQHFGVVLERTCLELNGQSCLGIEAVEAKKQIISSRSFSSRITCPDELSQAVCSHAAKAASKLRKQDSVCHYLSVFAKNSSFSQTESYTSISGQCQFITPTADTRVMVAAARQILTQIFKKMFATLKQALCSLISARMMRYSLTCLQTIVATIKPTNKVPQRAQRLLPLWISLIKDMVKTVISSLLCLSQAKASKTSSHGK
nr:hypothetical protein [Psychrobacter sp. KH172YL61]